MSRAPLLHLHVGVRPGICLLHDTYVHAHFMHKCVTMCILCQLSVCVGIPDTRYTDMCAWCYIEVVVESKNGGKFTMVVN